MSAWGHVGRVVARRTEPGRDGVADGGFIGGAPAVTRRGCDFLPRCGEITAVGDFSEVLLLRWTACVSRV